MALPRINTFPMYSTTIPSLQKQVRYRPYNVGEEKILLIAFESEDRAQISNAILNIIVNCIEEDIDTKELTVFDVEYLFLQIRSKAVGENSNLLFTCPTCETQNSVIVKVNEITIDTKNLPDKKIKITDDYTVEMKFLTFMDMITNAETLNVDNINELIFQLIVLSLDKLHTPDELLQFKDESRSEVENFVNNLPTEQYGKILEFISAVPKLSHDVEYTCEGCNNDNKYKLEGLSDFF